jgi:hypothetical protein
MLGVMKQVFAGLAASALLGTLVYAAAPFEEMLQRTPTGANVLMIANVEQILRSEFARQHQSATKLADAFAERLILIPPDATQFVLVAEFDIEHLSRVWEAAIVGFNSPPNLSQLAGRTQQDIETVGGVSAIGTKRSILLALGDKEVGLMIPSSRQRAARWMEHIRQSKESLSPYLARVGSYGDTAGTDIILAVELAQMWPEKFIVDRLRKFDKPPGASLDVDRAAAVLAGIQGVRLGMKLDTKCSAMLVVDLHDNPAVLGECAKPLVLHALANAGLMLDDIANWKVTLGPKSISLQGYLSDEGLRHVMGIVELPEASQSLLTSHAPASKPAPAAQQDSLQRDASRKYFQTIERELDALRLQKDDAKTLGQICKWIENSARRIDRLSSLDVDHDLVEYSMTLSTELRQMTAVLQGVGINSASRQAGIYSGDSSFYDGEGDRDVQGARRQVRAEEKATGATSALDFSRLIANQRAAMRRQMTDKYKIPF